MLEVSLDFWIIKCKMQLRTLFVFRHGETEWNRQERFQGHLDIPLNETGKSQAQQLIPILREQTIEAILSSDLSRAVETAEIVARSLQVPVFQDQRLREAHLGDAQGLTRKEIEASFGEEAVKRWKSPLLSDADVSYPGGETGKQVFQRTLEAIRAFFEVHPFQRIGLASHGGVIRRLMQNILATSSHIPIPNGIVYQICFDEKNRNLSLAQGLEGIAKPFFDPRRKL